VNNFPLSKNQPLIPLFETVVNSIHAIEERRSTGAEFKAGIEIRVLRDNNSVFGDAIDVPKQITGFEIGGIAGVRAAFIQRSPDIDVRKHFITGPHEIGVIVIGQECILLRQIRNRIFFQEPVITGSKDQARHHDLYHCFFHSIQRLKSNI
jgi:hypothetical protein